MMNNVDDNVTVEQEGWIKGDSLIYLEKSKDRVVQIPDLEPDREAIIEIQRVRNPALISDDDYHKLIAKLNVSQRHYLYHYTSTLRNQMTKKTCEPMLHFISGPAGTGKSLLIKVLTQATIKIVSNQVDDPDISLPKILLTAPTGKAAFAIKGITLHNAFRLPLAQFSGTLLSLNANIANNLRSQYFSVKTLVIDEIGMVSRQTFRRIDNRLRQMFVDAPFGGLNVILFGDLFQLPAIGVPLYAPVNSVEDNDDGMSHLTGRCLWDLFKFYELTEIMRQRDDKIFAERLTRLGRGQMTVEDERFFESLQVNNVESNDVADNKPIHLFGTNKEVDKFNRISLSQLAGEEIISEAFDSGCEKDVKAAAKLTRNNTLGIAKSIILKRNARYMVITNVDTEDGIVNGASGILKDWDNGTTKNNRQIVVCAWLLFDDESVGQNAKNRYNKKHTDIRLVPIICVTKTFSVGKNQNRLVIRMQLPIIEAEAITIHKSQGASYENVVFHIPYHKECALIYVACSRATNSKGLRIVGTFPRRLKANPKVIDEMKILREEKLLIPKFIRLLQSSVICVSLNIRSLKKHHASITNDPCFDSCNVLFFQETGLLEHDHVNISNMIEKCRVPAMNNNRKCGVSCFFHASIDDQVQICSSNIIRNGQGHCEYVYVKINNINYFGIYISPKFSFRNFLEEFKNLLIPIKAEQCIIVGDFNNNLNDRISDIKVSFGSEFKIGVNESTTDYNSCLDNVIFNMNVSVVVYEFLNSDHRPIFITDPLVEENAKTNTKPSKTKASSDRVIILQDITIEPAVVPRKGHENFKICEGENQLFHQEVSSPTNNPDTILVQLGKNTRKEQEKFNICEGENQLFHQEVSSPTSNPDTILLQLGKNMQDLLWNSYVLIVKQNFPEEFDNLSSKKSYNLKLIHSGITWKTYILSQSNLVQKIVTIFRLKELVTSFDDNNQVRDEITNHLPKALKEVYSLIRTTGDGSCFFHAVSLNLFNNEKYSVILRFCTLFYLVKFKNKLEQSNFFVNEVYLMEAKSLSLTPKLCRILGIANTECYADAFAPLLMSEILQRPILVINGERPDRELQKCTSFDQLTRKILTMGNDHCFASSVARAVDVIKEPLVLSLFSYHYTAVLKKPNEHRHLPVVIQNVELNFDD